MVTNIVTKMWNYKGVVSHFLSLFYEMFLPFGFQHTYFYVRQLHNQTISFNVNQKLSIPQFNTFSICLKSHLTLI